MNDGDSAPGLLAEFYRLAIEPFVSFALDLNAGERPVLLILLAVAIATGYILGLRQSAARKGHRTFSRWRFPSFQNAGEEQVSRVLRSHFDSPDYHLMNHVTLPARDGTTQVDHILVSRFGVFVIETKHFSGWIFADEAHAQWTQVLFRAKFTFQNPIRQNYRHVATVRNLLDFLPEDVISSLVVFTGSAVFKTDIPAGVTTIDRLAAIVRHHTTEVMSENRLQFCVGRLETARLAISRQTDLEHVRQLELRHGSRL
jgi:hypothetical protein